MSQSPPFLSTASSTPASRQGMENCIDELAEMARTEVPPSQFLVAALSRLKQFTAAELVRFWRRSANGAWEVSGQWPVEAATKTELAAEAEEISWLTETAQTKQVSTRKGPAGHNGDTRQAARTLCPVVHAGQTVGLFDVTHELEHHRDLSPDIVPFLRVISEITADFLSQAELRQLREARVQWQQWDQFSLALMRSTDLRELAATVANDGRLLVGCDRVTLLGQSGSSFSVLATTGVDQVEPRSNTVGSIASIAKMVAAENQSAWFNAAAPDAALDPAQIDAFTTHAGLTAARAVGIIPLPLDSSNAATKLVARRAVLAVEQFQDVSDFSTWRSRAELLANRTQPLLLAALDRESIPFFKTLQRWRHTAEQLNRSRLIVGMLFLATLAGLLVFIPAEYTVTGIAELVPDHRREVFASSSGIVDQLLVQHGDDVKAEQPLIVLRDPQLELELPRIIGEIDVVRERLKGVLAARLAGSTTPDAANRVRQLTSEEAELKERLESLNRQRNLVEEQQSALTLKSPIPGKVLTWDVSTLLSARPVERGHALLTIGDTSGPWVVEMRIADKDFGHVRRAQKRLKPDLDVDFLLASDPSHTYRGTIRDVAESTSLDDQLGISVLVTVAIEPHQISNPHAGTTVIPRIHCGRESIGYVWLHDLIDAVRTRLLF